MSNETKRIPLEAVPVGRRVRVYCMHTAGSRFDGTEGVVFRQYEADARILGTTLIDDERNAYRHGCWLAEILPDPPADAKVDGFIRDATEGKLAKLGRSHEERWGQALHLLTDENGWVGADCRAFVRALVADLPPPDDYAGLLAEVRMTVDGLRAAREHIEGQRDSFEMRLIAAMQVIGQAEGRLRDYVGEGADLPAPDPDPRDAEIAHLCDCAARLSDHVIALGREAEEARERDRRNAVEIDKLRERLAYFDRQAAQHDDTGRVAGHAEQCACHGCTTGPLRVEVERLREALAKYGRHLVSCDLERCDGAGRPMRSDCTCGLADAIKERL